ncbi:MAG: hypothetical protein JSV51_06130 [Candidatus Bathyarchaeota archaeon]|nr:MAG: hypothetical protein JSV51_06130 [Candidatus Bathyarchaeota archaeon]
MSAAMEIWVERAIYFILTFSAAILLYLVLRRQTRKSVGPQLKELQGSSIRQLFFERLREAFYSHLETYHFSRGWSTSSAPRARARRQQVANAIIRSQTREINAFLDTKDLAKDLAFRDFDRTLDSVMKKFLLPELKKGLWGGDTPKPNSYGDHEYHSVRKG